MKYYGEIRMQVDVDFVNKLNDGWKVRLFVKLSSEELSMLNMDKLDSIEDYTVNFEGSDLHFDCFVNTEEPWEDESLEELIKAIKIETEYHVQALLE